MRKHILFEDQEEGIEWVATYYIGSEEFDDDMESTDTTEISFFAEDFSMAVKYAQQYLRKMQSDEETSSRWASAEILSIQMH